MAGLSTGSASTNAAVGVPSGIGADRPGACPGTQSAATAYEGWTPAQGRGDSFDLLTVEGRADRL